MPVTSFQKILAAIISVNRSPDSYLAGGAALNFEPNTIRYSNDLDYFNDNEKRVLSAFEDDQKLLIEKSYTITVEIKIAGYIRAIIAKNNDSTKVEWAHDSAWRFLPPEKKEGIGYVLHPVDLALNKVLALAGRDEARDFLDVHDIHKNILSLGALCWACSSKDPGFTPLSLLALLKRKGKYRAEEFERLDLNIKIDLQQLKADWQQMLVQAESLINGLPPKEAGCLYYDIKKKKIVTPNLKERGEEVQTHLASLGGVLPRIIN